MKKWQSKLNADPLPWLLSAGSWTRYRCRLDLMDQSADEPEMKNIYAEMTGDPRTKELSALASQWFPECVTGHNVPRLSHYLLNTLVEFGIHAHDPLLVPVIDKVFQHFENGNFAIRQTLPKKGKGFGKPDPSADEWHAMPCDSPLITYSLARAGMRHALVSQNVQNLKQHWRTNQGWFCHFFFVEGQYKKLNIGCPMAGLLALQVFSLFPDLDGSVYAQNAYAPVRYHRDSGKSLYYFGRSKKFRTFKYPFVWYNALYLADVLTRFTFLKNDPLVVELVQWIEKAQDADGRFKPTSMFRFYKDWDFADKKQPSPWITLLCCRILRQYYGDE